MLSKNLKKLTYRLHYRGIKELDIFFSRTVHSLSSLSGEEQDQLTLLIEEEEDMIYRWVLGFEKKPDHYKKIIEKVLTLQTKPLY
jgi:succinate dehydrogenase flavin-adding protein (antitoxin of CptAB toxin-antitoxin module)